MPESLREWAELHGEPYGLSMDDFEREEAMIYDDGWPRKCPECERAFYDHQWDEDYAMCIYCALDYDEE